MRINVLPPQYLADQHLIAEYREIKIPPKILLRSIHSSKGIDYLNLPQVYTLNKGHAKFFYDKVGFVTQRFCGVLDEMKRRGFKTNSRDLGLQSIPRNLLGYYKVTTRDITVNLDRIKDRIAKQPSWYNYYGRKIDWVEFYSSVETTLELGV